jgi:hypothetical protein
MGFEPGDAKQDPYQWALAGLAVAKPGANRAQALSPPGAAPDDTADRDWFARRVA